MLATSSAGYILYFVVYAVVLIFYIAAFWKIYEKAGLNGWAAIIPIYNGWTYFRAAGRPGWWVLTMIFPPVFLVLWIIAQLDMAKAFDRSVWFGIGLIFLSFIFVPILGYGSAQHTGRVG
jgi:hypothetical protein